MATSKQKKTDGGKVFEVTRSHDAFNQGDLIRADEDDWMKGRVGAGLFREVSAERLAELEARGRVVQEARLAHVGEGLEVDGGDSQPGANEAGTGGAS